MKKNPKWASDMEVSLVVGQHVFIGDKMNTFFMIANSVVKIIVATAIGVIFILPEVGKLNYIFNMILMIPTYLAVDILFRLWSLIVKVNLLLDKKFF